MPDENRPYRWADTPLDPLSSNRSPRSPRKAGSRSGWITVGVVLALFVGGAYFVNQKKEDVKRGESSQDVGTPPSTWLRTPADPNPTPSTITPSPTMPDAATAPSTVSDEGLSATVHWTTFDMSGGDFLPASRRLIAEVTVSNPTNGEESASPLDWKLQFADGHTEQATILIALDDSLPGTPLDFVGLPPGASTTGLVAFDLHDVDPSTTRILFDPDRFGASVSLSFDVKIG